MAACYAFAVQALDRHVTVTSVPFACTGLSHEEINQAVDRAIRTVVGPHRKVIARRLAHREAAYLSYLVTVVPLARIGLHGTLAASTILLVALAAIGTG